MLGLPKLMMSFREPKLMLLLALALLLPCKCIQVAEHRQNVQPLQQHRATNTRHLVLRGGENEEIYEWDHREAEEDVEKRFADFRKKYAKEIPSLAEVGSDTPDLTPQKLVPDGWSDEDRQDSLSSPPSPQMSSPSMDPSRMTTMQRRKWEREQELLKSFGGGLDSCLKKHESALEKAKRLYREEHEKLKNGDPFSDEQYSP